jgi:hypothetical protein
MKIGMTERTTFIMFVDKYDQLISKQPVPPDDHTFHLKHPDQIPDDAAALRYYDHTTEIGFGHVTYHNACNHSAWLPIRQLAQAS